MIEIKHVQQQDDKSCVIACIAMITGKSFEDIYKIAKEVPCGEEEQNKLLVLNNIYPKRFLDNTLYINKRYIVSTPSLNFPGIMHCIVIDTNSNGSISVYDPQKDVKDKKYYTHKNLESWGDVTEIIYINRMDKC